MAQDQPGVHSLTMGPTAGALNLGHVQEVLKVWDRIAQDRQGLILGRPGRKVLEQPVLTHLTEAERSHKCEKV